MKNNQKGFSLIELLMVIGITTGLLTTYSHMASDGQKQLKDTATAQNLKATYDAANRYIKDNYAAISTASATSPVIVTTDMLENAGYLALAQSGKNPYGQSTQVEITKTSNNTLSALVLTKDGRPIPEAEGPMIAAKVGSYAGYLPQSDPTKVKGAYGGWSTTLTNTKPGAGHLAALMFFNNGEFLQDGLSRYAIPGHPELNTMYTPLNMKAIVSDRTSDALCNVADVNSWGRIAADVNGNVMSCQNGVWQRQASSWRDPIASFASFPMTNNGIGDVRMDVSTGRGFMWNGSKWVALGVDENGNLTMPGTMTAGKVKVTDIVTSGTPCSASGEIARDANGLILSCQSGVWKSMGGSINWSNTYRQYVGDGGTCAPGYIVYGAGGWYATYTAGYLYCVKVN